LTVKYFSCFNKQWKNYRHPACQASEKAYVKILVGYWED